MAFSRFLYRRLNCVGLFLIAATLWIFYLIASAPLATDKKYANDVLPRSNGETKNDLIKNIPSVTRSVMVKTPEAHVVNKPPQPPEYEVDETLLKETNKQAIPPPPKDDANDIKGDPLAPDNTINIAQDKDDSVDSEKKHVIDVQTGAAKLSANKSEDTASVNKTVELVKAQNKTQGPVLKVVEKKVIEFGEKWKNKTLGDWETVKNKTLEKLTDLGVIQKPKYIKLVYSPVNWNVNLSVESIGNIMKDTEFLKKRQNLTEVDYYPLLAPNSTGIVNMTSAKYGLGYCDCMDLACSCCVRVMNKWMRLNSTTCSTITFSSKSQELIFDFAVDKKPIFSRKIAAEFPPKICLESTSRVAGMCVLFSNVTSKVNVANEDHKIHLSGCMEYDLTLYNKTVNEFPVGCFQIPGLHKDTDEKPQQNLGNFVP